VRLSINQGYLNGAVKNQVASMGIDAPVLGQDVDLFRFG
jgi:hypothetical protein